MNTTAVRATDKWLTLIPLLIHFFFFLHLQMSLDKGPCNLARVNGNVTEVNIEKQDSDKDII